MPLRKRPVTVKETLFLTNVLCNYDLTARGMQMDPV